MDTKTAKAMTDLVATTPEAQGRAIVSAIVLLAKVVDQGLSGIDSAVMTLRDLLRQRL